MSIPVRRAQDCLKAVPGSIRLDPENELHVIGTNSNFTKVCEPKGLIALPRSWGSAEVGEIVSDTELYLRKPFKFSSPKTTEDAKKALREGSFFRTAPRIDQSEVYSKVFEHLAHGHCLGLFSEGGSHDRPDLLPLKAGVAIMALGAMEANPDCNVKIVPCGMNYFHPHKFRSRAVVEFGMPIEISPELVAKYSNPETSKDAIKDLLEIITGGLKSVTVTCPDYESLTCVQVARRLYSNNMSKSLSLQSIVEMNRRLIKGYLHFKDEPRIIELKKSILQYNDSLRIFKIPDHLVEGGRNADTLTIFIRFITSLIQLIVLGTLALPGIILFSPVFIATKLISEKKRVEALAGSTVKIQARDVIATWKILVSIGFAPLLYVFYSALGTVLIKRYWELSERSAITIFCLFYLFSAMITYSALIFGDKGMDLFKSIRPLWLALVNKQGLSKLRAKRRELSLEITEVINEYGPQLFPDFNLFEYEKRLELKKLRRDERRKQQHEQRVALDSEDEYEEEKTQRLRQRRAAKKQAKSRSAGTTEPDQSIKEKLTSSVPIIFNDNETTSSVGLSSSSENDMASSDSEFEREEKSADTTKLGLVRDAMIRENRERNEKSDS
ncbi:hypothetical protein OGAPHI_002070 [Ogataea philodendri]|uniref:Phospholipid/glycerol acyltransferase domain-containing protein n=1 Tax=Ogataea philodendri TaxID=1378263 RepID=A0A9P8T7U1_9ASCO|nr:uncharacterized protein OGAPHI_002070 [Ogataea philodendri]KAH3668316.1 hypothetical protein OGAPHI_002070 [Ogataea philodendri]